MQTITTGITESEKKILIARDLTLRFGILYEFQIKQLKAWPLIYFDAKESEFVFNYDTKEIVFRITKGRKKIEDLDKRILALEKSVDFLLGKEFSISIYYGKKKIK